MFKVKKRALLWLVFTILFLLFAGLFGWTIKIHRDYLSIPPETLIGNKISNVNALKEKGFPFSFLVIGDTQGRGMAETLIKSALFEKNFSFMVIIGDFVKRPDIWDHRFFLAEMTTEIKPPFPVFLTVGNHDVDYALKIKEPKRRVTPEVFESLYGARNFDFVFNQCLFILLDLDMRNQTGYLNYLRNTLSQKGGGKKHIFIFLHFPPQEVWETIHPSIPQEEMSPLLPNENEFFSLLETYKVTTCFFGHYHGYWRGQRNGVNLVVVGGGGGSLKSWQPEWGKFHHILKVTVDQSIISEEMITRPEKLSVDDSLEWWIWACFLPIIENRTWVVYGLFILFLSSGAASLNFFILSLKKRKRDERKRF